MSSTVSNVIAGAMGPASRIPGTFFTHEGLRLRTSIRLRWLAVAGQATAVLWVYFGMGFVLPIWLCAIFIALSAWVNIVAVAQLECNCPPA